MTTQRIVDVGVAGPSLLLAAGPILLASTAVYLTMGRPIFYHQTRYGLHGKPFTMIKIRSMTSERDARGELLPDQERLTRLGAFLRRWAIDELPQFWNILKGDMSLIGPRPMSTKIKDQNVADILYSVRPGIFSWAKVKEDREGGIRLDQKLKNDLFQIRNPSLCRHFHLIAASLVNLAMGRHDPEMRKTRKARVLSPKTE